MPPLYTFGTTQCCSVSEPMPLTAVEDEHVTWACNKVYLYIAHSTAFLDMPSEVTTV